MGVKNQTSFGLFVLEAFPPEVRLTQLDIFARRSNGANGNPRLMVGRLNNDYLGLIPEAMEYGIARRNIPYDQLYLTNEQALYCSELVVDMFKHANENSPFFAENPMSFRDNVSGELHPTWINYYAYYGIDVPEGEPGSNPGDISNDNSITIYDVRGSIPGFQ